jgi:hypothetical protein
MHHLSMIRKNEIQLFILTQWCEPETSHGTVRKARNTNNIKIPSRNILQYLLHYSEYRHTDKDIASGARPPEHPMVRFIGP